MNGLLIRHSADLAHSIIWRASALSVDKLAMGAAMNGASLPKVLRDGLGRLPGDRRRRARLKAILYSAVLRLWEIGTGADFTDEEVETVLAELLDDEVVRRLAEELGPERARS
jgi:hypothetical protein